jgi:hypothetical protein
LAKPEHPLDDADRMFNPGPHFGLGPIFRPFDPHPRRRMAVAAIGKVLGLSSELPDHRELAAIA